MKRLVLLASLAVCQAVFAAPPTEDSVKELLRVTQSQKMVDMVLSMMQQSMAQSLEANVRGKTLSPQQQRALRLIPERTAAFARQELGWATAQPLLVQAYVETYTQEDVDALIQFFGSPAGQRYVDKQTVLAERVSGATRKIMIDAMPRLQADLRDALREAGIEPK